MSSISMVKEQTNRQIHPLLPLSYTYTSLHDPSQTNNEMTETSTSTMFHLFLLCSHVVPDRPTHTPNCGATVLMIWVFTYTECKIWYRVDTIKSMVDWKDIAVFSTYNCCGITEGDIDVLWYCWWLVATLTRNCYEFVVITTAPGTVDSQEVS
jgi:hypothetical protein